MPFACTTIGYSGSLTLTLESPREDATLELCLVAGCTPAPLDDLVSDAAVASGTWALATGDGVDGWVVELAAGGEEIGYRVTDGMGAVLAEGVAAPVWERVGGSAQCGGPMEAAVVLG